MEATPAAGPASVPVFRALETFRRASDRAGFACPELYKIFTFFAYRKNIFCFRHSYYAILPIKLYKISILYNSRVSGLFWGARPASPPAGKKAPAMAGAGNPLDYPKSKKPS